jgi:hypothetical protein
VGISRNSEWLGSALKAIVIGLSFTGVVAADDDDRRSERNGPIPLTVPKAKCGPNDHPETALQGQVPATLRAAGFKGFNCNLELVGQVRGDGANWQTTQFKQKVRDRDDDGDRDGDRDDGDKTRTCGYHGTASAARSLPGRTNFGVRVVDLTDRRNPTITAFLNTPSMHDPWESLKVNERRQVLGADNGQNGAGGPEVDLYDISQDCSHPQLLASAPVGTGADGGGVVTPIVGHEGAWAPDGLTYYGGGRTVPNNYYAVDTSDLSRPKLLGTWFVPRVATGARTHGLSVSDDGLRGYFVSIGSINPVTLTDPNVPANNGLVIYDLSEFQKRLPNPQPKVVGEVYWKDGATAQHTINVKIRGKPFVISVDEGGSGGVTSPAQLAAACAAGMPPFPMARIIDISDERNPKIVTRIMHEVHDPKNCPQVLPDLVGLSIFTYGTHYCSVDNRRNATTLACGMFNSGIRVFDIRDPLRPKEIAYFNPAGTTTASPGSNHSLGGNWRAGGPDWCSAQLHLDAKAGTLWSTCQDNGVLALKFRKGVWPFEDSKTPPGQQN